MPPSMKPKLFAGDTTASAVTSIGAPGAIGPGRVEKMSPSLIVTDGTPANARRHAATSGAPRSRRRVAQALLDARSYAILTHLVADVSSSVLIVADPKRVGELATALGDP